MTNEKYQRLTRAHQRSLFGWVSISRSSLWLGTDHVLCIDANGFTETYKRFFFRDIQAIMLRKTDWWVKAAIILGGIAALFASFVLVSEDTGLQIFWGILAAVLFVITAVHLAFGPTCVCHLRTAVQQEALVSLTRVRRARKVLARIRPLIIQAQGQLTPEEIAARMQGQSAGDAAGPASSADVAPSLVLDDPNAPPGVVS